MDALLTHEGPIRLGIFAGVLVTMALLEWLLPRRQLTLGRGRRWFANLAIVVVDTLALRLLFPVLAVGAAVAAQASGWGLFNLIGLPVWLEVMLAVLALDLLIYWQHRLFHVVPLFWRMHRMHHADNDIDVTTGLRFHPLEIVVSMLIKLAAIWLLGPAAVAVLIFEVLLNGTAMFNHANIRLPLGLDRVLRFIVVTPDMHRVHHSVHRDETDSNFGFNLPWWDHLFASYRDQPRDGHDGMRIGLPAWRGVVCAHLGWMLLLPFRGDETARTQPLSTDPQP